MNQSPEVMTQRLVNRTRISRSIPRRLLLEGKLHLLPIYALLRTSDLAREGMENSGSFRFADHIYCGKASGRYGFGTLLDGILLRLRGARSMRSRFYHSQREILAALAALGALDRREHTVVSVPAGIARDLLNVAESLRTDHPETYARTKFVGVDLDRVPLELSRELTRGHANFTFVAADGLHPASLPKDADIIASLGLGEFLTDHALAGFYSNCHAALRPGGVFITSAMNRDRISDYLARELAELHTHYRSAAQITTMLQQAGFATVRTSHDKVGLQTLAVAGKGGGAA